VPPHPTPPLALQETWYYLEFEGFPSSEGDWYKERDVLRKYPQGAELVREFEVSGAPPGAARAAGGGRAYRGAPGSSPPDGAGRGARPWPWAWRPAMAMAMVLGHHVVPLRLPPFARCRCCRRVPSTQEESPAPPRAAAGAPDADQAAA
jgi:hypothetical protein